MIDHALVKTTPSLFNETIKFYEKALEPLGYKKIREIPDKACGFGEDKADFWVFANGKSGDTAHVAFKAPGKSIHLKLQS